MTAVQRAVPLAALAAADLSAWLPLLDGEIAALERTLAAGPSAAANPAAGSEALAGLDPSIASLLTPLQGMAAPAVDPQLGNAIDAPAVEDRRREIAALLAAASARAAGPAAARAAELQKRLADVKASASAATPVDAAAIRGRLNSVEDAVRTIEPGASATAAAQIRGLADGVRQQLSGGADRSATAAARARTIDLLNAMEMRASTPMRARISDLRDTVTAVTAGDGLAQLRARKLRLRERIVVERTLRNQYGPATVDAAINRERSAASRELQSRRSREAPLAAAALPPLDIDPGRAKTALKGLLTACLACHRLDEDEAAMRPLPATSSILTGAIFSHRPHTNQTSCDTCHAVTKSNAGVDVNLPPVKSCESCHDAARARADCVSCHTYHPPSRGVHAGLAMKIIGRTGAVAGRDAIIGDAMRIGASADNDFRVEVTGISRHHARIVRDGTDFWLEDTGSTNGTFVNGLRVARERLRHLDVVTLGRSVDLIAVASETETGPKTILHAVRAAWLEPIDIQGGVRIDIPPGELTLGRSAPSNVLLDSPLVSHLHARLERTPDHLVVSDLASSNGTFVNGQLIREPVELADGDTLSIAGSRQFRVNIDGTTRHRASMAEAARTTVDSEWKTRLVWSADELVELEADRQRILAAWKKEQAQAAAAAQQPAGQKATPAAPKAAPKVAAPAPKATVPAESEESRHRRPPRRRRRTRPHRKPRRRLPKARRACAQGPTPLVQTRERPIDLRSSHRRARKKLRLKPAGRLRFRRSLPLPLRGLRAGPAHGSHSIRESDRTGRLVQARTGPPRGRAFG